MTYRKHRRRLLITPPPEVFAYIDEIHELTGTPRAAVVVEILEQVAPVFAQTIHALRIVHEQPREAQRIIQNFTNDAIGKATQGALDLDAELTALDARTVKGRRAKKGGIFGRPT